METQLSDKEISEINEYILREKATVKLKKSGIFFPAQPIIPDFLVDDEGSFSMPHDLTELESKHLGLLMTVLNNLLAWNGAVLSAARVDKLSAERIKVFTESKIRMQILASKEMLKDFKAREDKEAYINTHPLVIQVQERADNQAALEIMADQLYKDLERSQRTVSREISRRGGELDMFNREQNLK
jgi:hypothetical protein